MTIERMRDIHAFVHVAEAKSFTAAAERIGLSRSAVGKSVLRLEDRLGVRLLQRTTRSVSLTGEGAVFLERCIRILADLDEAEMSMLSHSQTPRGRLRLELPVSFGRLHVLPIVNQFMSKWPEISVNISFNDRFVDLIDEGIDLAIRTRRKRRQPIDDAIAGASPPGYLCLAGLSKKSRSSGEYRGTRGPQLPFFCSRRTPSRLAFQHRRPHSHRGRQRSFQCNERRGRARRHSRWIRDRENSLPS